MSTNYRNKSSIRLKTFRESLGLTQISIVQEFGSTVKTISNYETGFSEPKTVYLLYLAEKGLNIHWYYTGEGEMVKQTGEERANPELSHLLKEALKKTEPLTPDQELQLIELLHKNAQLRAKQDK